MTGSAARAALAAAALIELGSTSVSAQQFRVDGPFVMVVGTPKGGARMARIDASRRGLAASPLPASGLETEWRTALGFIAQQGPVVDSKGRSYVVGENGEVATLGRDGTILFRVTARAARPGPPALLSDDTLVFVDGSGEAVAVRDGAVTWRSRFGVASDAASAPIALEDGGVVVASGPDLAVLDAGGRERARIVLPAPTSHPLLTRLGKVVVVDDGGGIWSWTPGAGRAEREGGFGSDIDDSAALADDHTLVAAARSRSHVSTFDLVHRTGRTVAGPLGGLWLGPAAVDEGRRFYAMQNTVNGELLVAFDGSGTELGHAALGGPTRTRDPNKQISPSDAPSSTPPIVDAEGHVAFATTDGSVGVVSGFLADPARVGSAPAESVAVELVSGVCSALPTAAHAQAGAPAVPAVIALAPLPPSGLVAACRSGFVVAVRARRTAGGSSSLRL
jgi:hypothetical protein